MPTKVKGLVVKLVPEKYGLVMTNKTLSDAAYFPLSLVENLLVKPLEIGDELEFDFTTAALGNEVVRVYQHRRPIRKIVPSTVKWYDHKRGFGFVRVPIEGFETREAFMHRTIVRIYLARTDKRAQVYNSELLPGEGDSILVEAKIDDTNRLVVTWIEALKKEETEAAIEAANDAPYFELHNHLPRLNNVDSRQET